MTDIPITDLHGSTAAQPSLQTIVRLVEQSIEEQRDTRARLDAHIAVSIQQFDGFQKLFEGVRSTTNAQFLMLSGQIADMQKQSSRIEDHVGFLTAKVVQHDKRFDAIDERLDGVDRRLDGIDERLDGIDQRLDGIDKRFDAIDQRLDTHDKRFDILTDLVVQIRDAVIPSGGDDGS